MAWYDIPMHGITPWHLFLYIVTVAVMRSSCVLLWFGWHSPCSCQFWFYVQCTFTGSNIDWHHRRGGCVTFPWQHSLTLAFLLYLCVILNIQSPNFHSIHIVGKCWLTLGMPRINLEIYTFTNRSALILMDIGRGGRVTFSWHHSLTLMSLYIVHCTMLNIYIPFIFNIFVKIEINLP